MCRDGGHSSQGSGVEGPRKGRLPGVTHRNVAHTQHTQAHTWLIVDLASLPHQPTTCLQVWEGAGVVASARKLIGATNPLASEPGTIRGDFAIEVGRNIVHGSDSPENGERETGEAL